MIDGDGDSFIHPRPKLISPLKPRIRLEDYALAESDDVDDFPDIHCGKINI